MTSSSPPWASAGYQPQRTIEELPEGFFDVVHAAHFPQHRVRFRNDRWAARVGIEGLDDTTWVEHFARFIPLPGSLTKPLALRYHGHQFMNYNPRLGDGRGFLFAQLQDHQGRLLDLGTKGSGTTPYSRGGDGRLTLKGGVREVLATEMLEALGVNTSKTWSLVETGEALRRHDEPSPTRSCVLVRLGHSHIRFGSFQRHAYERQTARLRMLLEFCVTHYMPELASAPSLPVAFVKHVTQRTATLCGQWMAAGFVHGVLNTDNMNINGESFDYGPYRFVPTFDPKFVAAYFDHGGIYRYGRQPEACIWNLQRLAESLELLETRAALSEAVTGFNEHFQSGFAAALLRRLGLASAGAETDGETLHTALDLLRTTQVGFDQFFFDWFGGVEREQHALEGVAGTHYRGLSAHAFRDQLAKHHVSSSAQLDHAYWQHDRPVTLVIDEIEALWDAIDQRDDWQPFAERVAALRVLGEASGCVSAEALRVAEH